MSVGLSHLVGLRVSCNDRQILKTEFSTLGSFNPVLVMFSTFAASGSNLLMVHGISASFHCPSLTAKVGWSSCESSMWLSDSSVVARRPSKIGGSSRFEILQVSLCDKQRTSVFEHLSGKELRTAETIVSKYNELLFSSSQILILGGFAQSTWFISSKMNLGGTNCEGTTWTSSTGVTCKTHSNLAMIVKLRVTSGDHDHEWHTRSYRSNSTASLIDPNNSPVTGSSLMQVFGKDFSAFDFCDRQKTGYTACESSVWTSSSKIVSKVARTRNGEKMQLILSATPLYVQVQANALTTDTNNPSFNLSEIHAMLTPSSGSVQVALFGRTVLMIDRTGSARMW
jgi:hypothetical protein